jgi:hypothetical protein
MLCGTNKYFTEESRRTKKARRKTRNKEKVI